jgi:undecaprenyl diphosphate synthase
VIQSTSSIAGLHVAIIMDGNGRWATRRGWTRSAGHRAGTEAVRRVVKAAPGSGIGILTLYAFSADNWQRPPREVETLMNLFRRFLKREAPECARRGIRLNVIGRRDRLSLTLVRGIEAAEHVTAGGESLLLRIAVDYSARDAILRAAQEESGSRDAFSAHLNRAINSVADTPPVDLLIRSGGEKRLSDFLLWESAYAELCFSDVLWPDFDGALLQQMVDDFHKRERRFGGLKLGKAG